MAEATAPEIKVESADEDSSVEQKDETETKSRQLNPYTNSRQPFRKQLETSQANLSAADPVMPTRSVSRSQMAPIAREKICLQ